TIAKGVYAKRVCKKTREPELPEALVRNERPQDGEAGPGVGFLRAPLSSRCRSPGGALVCARGTVSGQGRPRPSSREPFRRVPRARIRARLRDVRLGPTLATGSAARRKRR